MNAYRDIFNIKNTYLKKGEKIGIEKGEKKGKIEVAKNLLKNGVDIQIIMNVTGLTEKEINDLKDK